MDSKVCNHTIKGKEDVHQLCVSIVPIFNHLQQEDIEEISKTTHPIKLKRSELL